MYIAHINDKEQEQSVYEHNRQTAELCKMICSIPQLKSLAYICALLHDAGKYTDEFLTYIRQAHVDPKSVKRGSVTHSMAGAQIITELYNKDSSIETIAMELVRHAVLSHHGLYDCINPDGEVIYQKREKPEPQVYQKIKNELYKDILSETFIMDFHTAANDMKGLLRGIINFSSDKNQKKMLVQKKFYLGMCERFLLASLIDADRIDTECFMESKSIAERIEKMNYTELWNSYLSKLENRLHLFQSDTNIKQYRKEISQACKVSGEEPDNIYQFVVPTGAGKTLASFRYAFTHAAKYHKKHIIYVAPYRSILEQNAKELKKVLGDDAKILEHHSDVVLEDDNEMEEYNRLISNWDVPVIITTAVQFLNTLFLSKTASIRRMNSLCDSVIIIDEIQALPLRCTYLFNLSMNFLNKFGSASIVLCSATQPPLDVLADNHIHHIQNMIPDGEKYQRLFKRVTLIDQTDISFTTKSLAPYVLEKLDEEGNDSLLVIVNKKSTARLIAEELNEQKLMSNGNIVIYHLSNYMCPKHRLHQIDEMKEKLESISEHKQKIICISTQLIEAGVDLSFHTVIRSLAGMDSIIQAAGRCNRHGEHENGNVYIVKLEDENLSRLKDIKNAQEAAEQVLYQFKQNSTVFDDDLLSVKAVQRFYAYYYNKNRNILFYPSDRYDTTILDMLSQNQVFYQQCNHEDKKWMSLSQAFRTAGDAFEVIEDLKNIDLVVPYEGMQELLQSFMACKNNDRKRKVLRELQQYAVSVPVFLYEKLKPHIHEVDEIKIIDADCYDTLFGISNKEVPFAFLEY